MIGTDHRIGINGIGNLLPITQFPFMAGKVKLPKAKLRAHVPKEKLLDSLREPKWILSRVMQHRLTVERLQKLIESSGISGMNN